MEYFVFRINKYQTIYTPLLTALLLSIASNAQADIIDVTSSTSLKGAYVLEQPTAREVSVVLFVEAGEFDNSGPEGLAHYLEHLVFWSADKAHGSGPKDRTANAWTSRDWTGYWNSGPVEKIGDMITHAAKVFAEIDVDPDFAISERDIVEREFDLRLVESASWQLYEKLHRKMYQDHPFSRSVIGDKDSIGQFTPSLANQFMDRWYLANNATLLISGPIKAAEIGPLLKAKFNDLPTGTIPTHVWKEPIATPASVDLKMSHRNLSVPKLLYIKHAPGVASLSNKQQFVATELLSDLLNSSLPGSITKPLYYDNFLTLSVSSACYVQPDGSVILLIEAEPFDDVDAEQLFAAIDHSLVNLMSNESFEASFNQVKDKRIKTLTRAVDGNHEQLKLAATSITQFDQALSAEQYINEFDTLSAQDAYTLLEALVKSDTVARGSAYPEK